MYLCVFVRRGKVELATNPTASILSMPLNPFVSKNNLSWSTIFLSLIIPDVSANPGVSMTVSVYGIVKYFL